MPPLTYELRDFSKELVLPFVTYCFFKELEEERTEIRFVKEFGSFVTMVSFGFSFVYYPDL
jgi:hypothetical protein